MSSDFKAPAFAALCAAERAKAREFVIERLGATPEVLVEMLDLLGLEPMPDSEPCASPPST